MACAAVTRLSRSRARHTHDTLTAWAAAISGADHPRPSPAIRSWRLSARRAGRRAIPASASGLRAPIDAPAGKPPVDQAGAASQLLGDLRRGVPPLGVELDDLPVVDVRAELGWTRPARYSPSHQPVVHRLSHHPQPGRRRRQRQPLIDIQSPQRPDIRAHPRPRHHPPLCHPDNPTLARIASAGPWSPPARRDRDALQIDHRICTQTPLAWTGRPVLPPAAQIIHFCGTHPPRPAPLAAGHAESGATTASSSRVIGGAGTPDLPDAPAAASPRSAAGATSPRRARSRPPTGASRPTTGDARLPPDPFAPQRRNAVCRPPAQPNPRA